MFCRSCGAQNKDDATFCQSCGAPLSSAGGESAGTAGAVHPAKKPNIVLIGAAAIIVAVAVLLFVLLGGRSQKDVVKKLVNGVTKGDAKSIVALIPNEVLEEACDEMDMDKEDLIDELDDTLDDMLEWLDDEYDKWKITYKVKDTDDYSKKERNSIIDDYDDEYDIKVKDATRIKVKFTMQADDDEDSTTISIPVIKVGKSWYLDFVNLEDYSLYSMLYYW